MNKKILALLTALLLMLSAAALAEAPADAPAETAVPAPAFAPGSEEALVAEAVEKALPGAVVTYVIKEFDDGRWEWEAFFRQENLLGECTVDAETYVVGKSETYGNLPADALDADAAVAKLQELKGEVTVTDLELESDDGRLFYEGEAELNGVRYEFEMTVAGQLVDWERD